MAVGLEPRLGKRAPGDTHVGEGHHRILVAMHKQDRRLRQRLGGEPLRHEQPAREGDDPGDRLGPARQDVQRHHRALRKPDDCQLVGAHPLLGQARVEEGVEVAHRLRQARLRLCLGRSVQPGDREPLPAEGVVAAGLWRVGRKEDRVRQMRRQRIGQPQKVGPVGAVTMQEDHHRPGLAGPCRLAAELHLARHLVPSRLFTCR